MNIYTFNVGQGQFAVITSVNEAIVIDTHVPLSPAMPIVNVKQALASVLAGKNLIGLLITGFDDDHFCEVGIATVLHKYRPNWIAYPRYFKKTQTADACFDMIEKHDPRNPIRRISISLDNNATRFYTKLSSDFAFEMFSPHAEDMTSSNNCSIVCKVREVTSGRTYLITGDTEIARWGSISRIFGASLKCDVLAAGHHGSKNGVTRNMLEYARPHTVLISAGVNNQYGHPDKEAQALYGMFATKVYQTNSGKGQSLKTVATSDEITTFLFEP
jgi:beta-lactamase superfamily II metal-dependent hydrolase